MILSVDEINSLRSDLMKILDKNKCSYYDFAHEIGISESCLMKFLFEPNRSFLKKTEEKIKAYIQKELEKPVPLSVQEINLLQSQNIGLKKQNESLQAEKDKYKEEYLALRKHIDELLTNYRSCLQKIKEIYEEEND